MKIVEYIKETIRQIEVIMMKNYQRRKHNLNIFLFYDLIIIIMGVILYFIIPNILNYPPGSINTKFDKEYSGITYNQQFILLISMTALLTYIFLRLVYQKIYKWERVEKIIKTKDLDKIREIRRIVLNVPHLIYFFQGFFPVFLIIIMRSTFSFFTGSDIKIILILLTYVFLWAVISYTLSRGYFRELLRKIQLENYDDEKIFKITLKAKAFLQIIPLFVIAILFTALVGYTQITKERGNLIFRNYLRQLNKIGNSTTVYTGSQIKDFFSKIELEQKNDVKFLIAPDGKIKTSPQTSLSKFFIKYTKEIAFQYQGHTYSEYGSDDQGAVKKIKGKNGDWIIGIKYNAASSGILISFVITLVALLSVAIFVLYFYAKTLSDDIKTIVSNLFEIVEMKDRSLEEKLPVISNDETGDLVIAFNKIQDLEKQHSGEIEKNQRILLERERLATLGQMFVGITHNLRSPIMSIAGGLEALKELIKEYEESIDNDNVTKADHHEIAREMNEWFESTKPYCTFMSDLISAVREQVIPLNTSILHSDFTIEELVKRIELLLKYELKKNYCIMETDIQVDFHMTISGEVNNLVQVCNNLIMNAIQAYDGNGGKIEFRIAKQENRLLLIIKDYGKGMPPDIQNKIFHQIITTKGAKRTGLGLYMSYLAIKGCFRGDLYFESKENEGTTFYISIPYQTEIVEDDGEIKVL
jgi:signal transduction histidine kinase